MTEIVSCQIKNKSKNNFEFVDLDGIVKYSFNNDANTYWLKRVDYIDNDNLEIRFIPDFHALLRINELCQYDGMNKIIEGNMNKDFKLQTLYYLEQYRNQERKGDNPTHFGGELFTDENEHLFLCFGIKGKGIVVNKICKKFVAEFDSEGSIPCTYKPDHIESKILVLIYYDSTYTLPNTIINNMELTKTDIEQFSLLSCE